MIEEHSYGIIPLKRVGDQWKVFVVLHKGGNHWGFPKGHPEEGETPQETATRELKEETGLIVDNVLLTQPISENYTFYRDESRVSKTVSYFPAIVSGEPSYQEAEVREGRWLSFEMALMTLTFSEARALFKEILINCFPGILSRDADKS